MTNYLSQKGGGKNKQKDDRICHRFLKVSSLFNGQDCCRSEQTDLGCTVEPTQEDHLCKSHPYFNISFSESFPFFPAFQF